ncbi:uncharacterized protein [Macrobrachium rosenbergii]|uniref:uncharacterized protein n=1 Tax=Macrobrachium rosenbergii TaxID=79674 RepID=UPI0034D7965C
MHSAPSHSTSGIVSLHRTASGPLPVPTKHPEQCQAPAVSVTEPSPNLIPVLGPALVPVPEHTVDLLSGDPKFASNSLPVPLQCPKKRFAPSVPNIDPIPNLIPVPGPAIVPVPEHSLDLPSGDPSPDHLFSPAAIAGKRANPKLTRVPSRLPDHSGSSTPGKAS